LELPEVNDYTGVNQSHLELITLIIHSDEYLFIWWH